MQIRVGNRQDEPQIRQIVANAMAEHGEKPDSARDADLVDIEANYFWHDGVFLVAEEEGEIIGLVGARKFNSEQEIELVRLVVIPEARGRGVARALVDSVLFFSRNLEYEKLVAYPSKQGLKETAPCLGFKQVSGNPGMWELSLV
jgi:predicted N-acetyltransferase YhbS